MPHYFEEDELKQPQKACQGLRIDLKNCLLESDCCKIVSNI